MIAPLLAFASTLAFGALIAARLLADSDLGRADRVCWALAWSAPLGLGGLSIGIFAWRLIGLPRPGPELLAGAAVFGAAILATGRLRFGGEPERTPRSRTRLPSLPPLLAWLSWGTLALAVVGGARGFVQLTRHQEIGSWDAVAVWNARARLLTRGWDRFPELLAAVDRTSHPNYPLGLPASVAGLELAAGAESPLLPAAVAAAWSASTLMLLFLAVRSVAPSAVAALTTACAVSTPISVTWAAAQVADIPIAALLLGVLAVLASTLSGWEGPPLPASLAGVGLGLLPWVKNEGLPIAVLVAASYLATRRFAGASGARANVSRFDLTAFGIGAAPGLFAAILFKALWSPGSGLETYFQGSWGDRLLDWRRWWLPAREIAVRVIFAPAPSWWFLVWVVPGAGLLLALALGGARQSSFAFLSLALGAIVASWLPIYAATPYPQEWHVATSLDRLLLQLLPATLASAVVGLASITPTTER